MLTAPISEAEVTILLSEPMSVRGVVDWAAKANDVWVDRDGMAYVTDRVNGGLYIFEYTGGGL